MVHHIKKLRLKYKTDSLVNGNFLLQRRIDVPETRARQVHELAELTGCCGNRNERWIRSPITANEFWIEVQKSAAPRPS